MFWVMSNSGALVTQTLLAYNFWHLNKDLTGHHTIKAKSQSPVIKIQTLNRFMFSKHQCTYAQQTLPFGLELFRTKFLLNECKNKNMLDDILENLNLSVEEIWIIVRGWRENSHCVLFQDCPETACRQNHLPSEGECQAAWLNSFPLV